MTIDNMKDLKKVMQLCKQLGVYQIEIDGVKMSLNVMPGAKIARALNELELPPEASMPVPRYSPIQAQETQDEAITSDAVAMPDQLTDEQMLYYSAKAEPN